MYSVRIRYEVSDTDHDRVLYQESENLPLTASEGGEEESTAEIGMELSCTVPNFQCDVRF
eukprot:1213012-Rhodomonas_salina.3